MAKLGLGVVAGSFVLPVIIWLASKKLAKFIVGDRRVVTSDSGDLADINSTIFAAVGLLVFLLVFPDLVVWACQTFVAIGRSTMVYHAPRPSWSLLLSLLLKLILSLLLIFNSRATFRDRALFCL